MQVRKSLKMACIALLGMALFSNYYALADIPGDLNEDLKVDFIDFALLGQGWPTTYDINTLAVIAEDWLEVLYPEDSMGYCGCSMAENVADGYRTVGGRRMWGGYGTGGLVVQSWTDTNSSAWQLFDQ
jgi:hypothetical protein